MICASCEFEEFNAKGNMSENIMKVDEGRIENNWWYLDLDINL